MPFDVTPGFNLGISDKLRSVIPQFGVQNGKVVDASNPGADRTAHNQKNVKNSGSGNKDTKNNGKPNKPETPANPGDNLGLSGGGSGGSGAELAYYDTQERGLRNQLNRSALALNQGLANLGDSYNREVGKANAQRSRALEDFGIQREDTINAKQDALGRVDMNARTLNDSLRRTLAMAGGSNSSAYLYAAPNAVAREASGNRNDVLSDYADNERSLGLAERRAGEDFENLLGELQRDRNTQERDLRSGVFENQQSIDQQLAELSAKRSAARGDGFAASAAAQQPFIDSINNRQSQIDSLFDRYRSPQLQARDLKVETPQLRDYMVDKAAINSNAGAQQQQYSPYSNFLRRSEDEQLF